MNFYSKLAAGECVAGKSSAEKTGMQWTSLTLNLRINKYAFIYL